jgi:hypothetical protein
MGPGHKAQDDGGGVFINLNATQRPSQVRFRTEMFNSISALSHRQRDQPDGEILMKTMLMAVAAVATLGTAAVAMPAAAQPYGGYGYDRGGSIDAREAQLRERIARAEMNGRLTRGEARRLREQLWSIHRIEARYRYDGHLSRFERADLDQRLDRLTMRVRQQVRDDDYGYPRPRW